MANNLDDIFSAEIRRVGQFLSKSGQGYYIPEYQRPYSWDKKAIVRLFEDVLHGICQIRLRPDTMSFLGTIIVINDSNYQSINPTFRTKAPTGVTAIIDGQQRICTLLISNIVLHNCVRRLVKNFKGKSGSP